MNSGRRPRISWHAVATFLLLGTTLMASKLAERRPSESLMKPLDTIDRQISGFTGSDNPPLARGVLAALLPTQYLSRTYNKPGLQADVFVAYYAQQRAGESMHSPKACLPGSGWEIWDFATTDIPVNGHSFKVNKDSISRDGTRMLVLYWYQSKGRVFASEYLGKLLLARDSLLQNSTAGSIVRIVLPDQPGTLTEGRTFAAALIPQVQRCFGD
jgi:EpsI family protein